MDAKPKVSIITPCYNSAKTIEDTIISVLNQTYKNIEYIIVDAKSNDGTLDIINKYINDKRIKVISEKDNGIYDAMNKGIKLATGDLIGIINSDDWYEIDAVEKIIRDYDPSNIFQVLYGMEKIYMDNKEYQTILRHHQFLEKEMIAHPSCFVTKQVYLNFGMFNTEYKICADYEFMLRLFYADVKFVPIYEIISNFRLGGISSSQKGTIETSKMKYNKKLISKLNYIYIVLNSKIYQIYEKYIKNNG